MSTFKYLAYTLSTHDVRIPRVSDDNLLSGILTTAYFLGGVICVIIIIFSGILYTISQGDPGKIQTAKNAILYAVVGLIIIILAFAITRFVIGAF
ncbi:MAG: Mbov_0395 family pilin-like conjugal transfer protein [Candidatus Saccharimonadales bacterium]